MIKKLSKCELDASKFDIGKQSLDIIEETGSKLYELTENKSTSSNQLISFKESVNYAMESAKNAHLNKGQSVGVVWFFDLDNY